MKDLGFSQTEIASVNELLSDEYDSLWRNLIYGSLNGNKQIVEIAKQQVGVLNDKIPKYAGVATGIEWFKSRGQW